MMFSIPQKIVTNLSILRILCCQSVSKSECCFSLLVCSNPNTISADLLITGEDLTRNISFYTSVARDNNASSVVLIRKWGMGGGGEGQMLPHPFLLRSRYEDLIESTHLENKVPPLTCKKYYDACKTSSTRSLPRHCKISWIRNKTFKKSGIKFLWLVWTKVIWQLEAEERWI